MAALTAAARVVLAGAGNIGTQLALLLARLVPEGVVTIIDPDRFETRNLACQHLLPGEVGSAKAEVVAARMRAINPALEVRHHVASVADVPLGALRGDLIVSAVDNRAAREVINTRAWHAATPWMDTALDAAGDLIRVNLYTPASAAACGVCGWTDAQFAEVDHGYSCTGAEQPAVAPTGAPAELGAAAAAVACLQMRRFLAGDAGIAGYEVMMDLRHFRQYVARLPRNPDCRLDHRPWRIEELAAAPAELSLGAAFGLGADDAGAGAGDEACLRHDSRPFVRRRRCTACGLDGPSLPHLDGPRGAAQRRCSRCGGRLDAAGFDFDEELARTRVPDAWLDVPLAELGFVAGDVICLRRGARTRHFELGAARG